jgi:hypothetical protein
MILSQLSSQSGDKTEQSNIEVAQMCLANPELLDHIAEGLTHKDAALVGDCAEVLTKVAETRPELVTPHVEKLARLLDSKKTRVRWEAMHAMALVSPLLPDIIAQYFDRLTDILRTDSSTIVRDYSVDAIGNYARSGADAARAAYPVLSETLKLWDGKHAARALNGLGHVAQSAPDLRDEIMVIAQEYATHGRGVVQKAAKALVKQLE